MAGAAGHAPVRQRRPVRGLRPAAASIRSTSSPATTASRSGTWSPTTTSTTRPTARTTATARTRTSAGTAASRGRPTTRDVLGLRRRQARNLLATLLLSQGVPMLLAGDEFLRTQRGNNNAWCQDNEISWVDWALAESATPTSCASRDADRPAQAAPGPAAAHASSAAAGRTGDRRPDIVWHGVEPDQPDFSPDQPHAGVRAGRHARPAASRTAISTSPATPGATRIDFRIPPSPTSRPWRA